MSAFPINDVNWDAAQHYTPDVQSKSQDSYLQRKMVARMRFKPTDAQGQLDPERPGLLKRMRRLTNQAVKSPSSNATLFQKMRISSEQKLGQVALGYMMEQATARGEDLNDPEVVQKHLDLVHPGKMPLPSAPQVEKDQYAVKQAASETFWNEFLATPEARKVTNSTTYLHTHAHHANKGFGARLILRVGRLLGELGHVILAPSTIFTKMYRHTLDGLTRSNGLLSSALYCAGALTTLSLLTAYRAGEAIAAPFSMIVLFPLYSAGMVSCLIGKALDSAAWRVGFRPQTDSHTLRSIRECAQNRLAEQLVGLAKVQNHFASKEGEEGQMYVEMARDYSNEQANRKANTLTGGAAKWVSNQGNQDSVNDAMTRASELNESLLFSRLAGDAQVEPSREAASAKSVLSQIFSNHADSLNVLDAAGTNSPATRHKLIKTELRALSGAVKVFSGPRASGLIHEHSRLGDMDHMVQYYEPEYDPSDRLKTLDGDHPFPDKQVREHLEHIVSWAFDKTRLNVARGLCFISGTMINKSNKTQINDSRGRIVNEYRGIRGVLHRTARSISVNAESSGKYPLRNGMPAPIRKWMPKGGPTKRYFVKQVRQSSNKPAASGSLGHIAAHTDRYSGLTQKLYRAHKALTLVAEKYIQPARGNGGRIIDGAIRKHITGSIGQATSHYLSYAGSVALWGLAITPNLVIQEAAGLSGYPELLGTGLIPTAVGFVAGALATSAAALTLLSAAASGSDRALYGT